MQTPATIDETVAVPQEDVRALDALFYIAAMRRAPFSGTFELSPVCNFACPMCYVRRSEAQVAAIGGLIPWRKWLALAREASEAGMLHLLLTGGEPLVYPGFFELYNALHDMGLLLTLNSNGALMTRETVEELAKRPPIRVSVTLYGASEETYARQCGDPSAFSRVMCGIETLLDAGIVVKLNFSITPENYQDTKAVCEIARERNLALQFAGYMYPPRDGGAAHRLPPELAGRYRALADYWYFNEDAFLNIAESSGEFRALDECVFEEPTQTEKCCGLPMRCRAGRCTFWVNWRGEMHACGLAETNTVQPFVEGFVPSWEKVASFTDSVRFSPKCAACENEPLCHPCMAMVYAETGGLTGEPGYVCAFTEAATAEYRRLAELIRSGRGRETGSGLKTE